MSSLFSRDTESLVRELGRKGELVPMDSLSSTLQLHPFCLVLPELSCSEPICFQETVAGAVTRGVSLGTGQQGKATGSGALSRSSLLAMRMLRARKRNRSAVATKDEATGHGGDSGKLGDTGLLKLTAAPAYCQAGMKLRTPRPSFLQELQSWKEKESLYVVTEATEAARDATFQSRAQEPGGCLSSSWATSSRPVSLGGPEGPVSSPRGDEDELKTPGPGCGQDGRAPGEGPGLQDLRRQAGAQLEALARLPPEPWLSLLGALRELLQSPRALQELKDRVEQALDTGVLGQLGGPGGLILSTLRAACRPREEGPSSAFSEHWSVTSILGPNYNQMEETGFSLPLEVLSRLQHEDTALTRSLVESCGLELRGPGHPVTRDPEVVPQLSVLYASLAGLQLLAEPSSTALQADA
ncbi:gasdermin-A-like [Ovis canadensis]|uniref:gasdermin-A-like n=1 Tax=Ovis canadensis TaxID=37174 RepID=UPI003751C1C6